MEGIFSFSSVFFNCTRSTLNTHVPVVICPFSSGRTHKASLCWACYLHGRKNKAISLLGGTDMGAGRGWGATQLCAGLLNSYGFTCGGGAVGTPLWLLQTSFLGCGSSRSHAGLRSEPHVPSKSSGSDGDSFKPQRAGRAGGRGQGGQLLAVAVATGHVLWAQLLSLVSEEALPNKMSLSWDMVLSCDLVLMRNWALWNITRSCSCLSSR